MPPVKLAVIAGPMYDRLYEELQRKTRIPFEIAFRADHPTLNDHLVGLHEVPYDLVSTHTKYAPSQQRLLAPLDDVVPQDYLRDFLPTVLDLAGFNGKLYGLPRNVDIRLLHYRTDLMEKPPATWDELLQKARRLNNPPELYGFVFPGKESGLFGTFYELAAMAGSKVFRPDATLDVMNDRCRWALGLLRTLYQEQLAPPQITGWHYDEVHNFFREGRAAMVGDWPGYYADYRDPKVSTVAEKFALALYPLGPAGISLSYAGSHTFALTRRGVENPDAVDLLLQLTSTELQLTEARQGSVPVRRSVMKQVISEADGVDRQRWTLLLDAIEHHALIPPKAPRYPFVEDLIWATVQRAIKGELDIEEALSSMEDQSRKIIYGEG